MPKQIQITNGPSREELFDGLRLFAEKREVSFIIVDNGRQLTLPATMRSIQAEDGSGQSWNITGHITVKQLLKVGATVTVNNLFAGMKTQSFKAYFSTKDRKGIITLE